MSKDTAVLRGALAGMAGTAVMTMMMRKVAPRVIPREMRPDEFVPKQVVEWAEDRTGHPHALTQPQAMRVALGVHFAYGSASGALYGLIRERVDGVPPPLAGMLFGAGLWAIGFEGWMPALGVREAATSKPPKKWPMPIMAHLMYGAVTAVTFEALDGLLH